MATNPTLNELTGAAAIPRLNGELVFDAPWQSRAFGMVVGLHEKGLFHWEEFKDRLIAAVAETSPEDEGTSPATVYYRQWIRALESLLVAKGLVSEEDVVKRAGELASSS